MLKITPRQRAGAGMAALLLAGFCGLVLGRANSGWFLVALVFLALAFLVLQLPAATPDSRAAPAPGKRLLLIFEVPVAFIGEPLQVLGRLQADGWKLGGHGFCNAIDHDAYAVLETEAVTSQAAAAAAGRAVEAVGAVVTRVGEPKVIR